jgi:hypothetical protein
VGDGSVLTPGESTAIGAADVHARMLALWAIGGDGWAGRVTGTVSRLGEDARSWS